MSPVHRLVGATLVATVTTACSQSSPPTAPSPMPPPPASATADLVAVGDIGWCGPDGPPPVVAQTARLVDSLPGEVVLAGDLAYFGGSPVDFQRCFDPSWGQFRGRWRPTPGNHEYGTPNAAGYFQYFAEDAGSAGGYYAFRAGSWLVLMINSNIDAGRGSPQYEFARRELSSFPGRCAMAVWHHPLFTSGPNGNNVFMRDMWALLYERQADLVVAAHDHFYERFGKQDPDGRSDAAGLRQFIVGTGGAELSPFRRMAPNSQERLAEHGVLRLSLTADGYRYSFVSTTGAVRDSGADSCH